MNTISTSEQIREIAYSFQESRILLTAFELKIFTVLNRHMMTSNDIADLIKADSRATDRLLNALVGMGLIKKVKGKFYNSELAKKYLVEGNPDFMGGLYHTNHLWNTWNYLTESVQKGTSYSGDPNKEDKQDYTESFIAAMHFRGVKQAKIIAEMIECRNAKKMLDIGGGSGAFSMELAKRNKGLKAVIFDLPHIIPLSKKYVNDEGMSDSFSFIEGDYLKDEFGTGYDLILLSAIIHINNYEQNKKLIDKCFKSLNENGVLVISDFIMSEDRTQPHYAAMFSLNMLVGTDCGDTYTENEIKDWMTSAGLKDVERKNTSFGADLITGHKTS